ncbi:MAG: deoxyribose-phosphate aldolase [Synergistaceae bacterium]|jgi:deoxyribose-phosphate aldolase|nr:deoxyribose-phosphate aldolase [Synergistaceae bacterium]
MTDIELLAQRARRKAALAEAGLLTRPKAEAIRAIIDHTLLRTSAREEDIVRLCNEAAQEGFASVCVPLAWVPLAAQVLTGESVNVGTVAAFPLGAYPLELKLAEIEWAVANGAHEIDVVLHVGKLLDGKKEETLAEMEGFRAASQGRCLKVIVETPCLNDVQKVTVARLASQAKVDFIKTCTGFGGPASLYDVALLKSAAGDDVKIKASGGIRNEAQALAMMAVGADRIGTSQGLAILGKQETSLRSS